MKTIIIISILLSAFPSVKAFDFIETKIQQKVLHFSTVEEGDHYPFYVEQWINEEWVVVDEVYGKGGMDTNFYQVPLQSIFHGINKYRIKKETGWDYFSFSTPITFLIKRIKYCPL